MSGVPVGCVPGVVHVCALEEVTSDCWMEFSPADLEGENEDVKANEGCFELDIVVTVSKCVAATNSKLLDSAKIITDGPAGVGVDCEACVVDVSCNMLDDATADKTMEVCPTTTLVVAGSKVRVGANVEVIADIMIVIVVG